MSKVEPILGVTFALPTTVASGEANGVDSFGNSWGADPIGLAAVVAAVFANRENASIAEERYEPHNLNSPVYDTLSYRYREVSFLDS